MIYLGFDKITEQKARVYLRNYNPAELSIEMVEKGVLVDEVPFDERLEGKSSTLFVNPQTKEMWYEYLDLSKEPAAIESEIEEIKQENKMLKAQNNALSERADFIEDVVAEMAVQVYQ